MTEHTPTPWAQEGLCVDTAGGDIVAACYFEACSSKRARANAAFIVKACNMHKRLLIALEELHATVKGESPSLLNEDSGGNAGLDMEIEDLLAMAATPAQSSKGE